MNQQHRWSTTLDSRFMCVVDDDDLDPTWGVLTVYDLITGGRKILTKDVQLHDCMEDDAERWTNIVITFVDVKYKPSLAKYPH